MPDGLHIYTNERFTLAFRFVTETTENIFLTGKAGTGKTTFLKYLRQHAAKNMVVAAPTGVAAINAGGVTLHSLFQLPLHAFLPTNASREELLSKVRYNRQRLQLLRKMELLVIDEISMVRADTLDAVDSLLRSVRRNHHLPFGGVQLLFIGDLFQLPPVVKNDEWQLLSEYYPSPFFFDSLALREQMPLMIELTTIYRQKEEAFVQLLNKVRDNEMDPDDFALLHQRYKEGFNPHADEKYITLTSHNYQADQINQRELGRLLAAPKVYPAQVDGEFPSHIYPAEQDLQLKVGAQVMFLKNDVTGKRYFNGKIGTVTKLEEEVITVEADGEYIPVVKDSWENTRYTLNKSDGKLEQEILGRFEQFPLRLAWAITIHKSQGLTFEKVMIDAGAAFSSGQVYVALSRCTSLDGIVLLSRIPSAAIRSNEQVVKGQQSLTHKGSLAERFEGARRLYVQQQLEMLFSFSEIATAFNGLLYQLNHHQEKLPGEVVKLMQDQQQHFLKNKQVGERFIQQVNHLLKEESVIEKNQALQKRISDAALHFGKCLDELLTKIKNHTLITEHKEVAKDVDEALNELAIAITTARYYVRYGEQPFTLSGYLAHKLAFAVPKFNLSSYASGKQQRTTEGNNPELFDTLKRWRDMVFEDTALPLYMIANAETLRQLATYLPHTKKELAKIKGFGKAKVEKYGEDVLEIIRDYCERHEMESNMDALAGEQAESKVAVQKKSKSDTKEKTLELHREGKTIAEIAAGRGLAISTIEGHLAHYIQQGEVHIGGLVTEEKQQRVRQVLSQNKEASLTEIKQQIPECSFGELRMILAGLRKGEE